MTKIAQLEYMYALYDLMHDKFRKAKEVEIEFSGGALTLIGFEVPATGGSGKTVRFLEIPGLADHVMMNAIMNALREGEHPVDRGARFISYLKEQIELDAQMHTGLRFSEFKTRLNWFTNPRDDFDKAKAVRVGYLEAMANRYKGELHIEYSRQGFNHIKKLKDERDKRNKR